MYKIIALIGEAGTGKDSIMQSILTKQPGYFNEIISCTTRPMREGEQEGVNYYYLTQEEFTAKINNREMLEATVFNNWYYGTSIDALDANKINIGVFNPEGIRSIMKNPNVDVEVYKIVCSDKERLIRQLNREVDPNVEEIIRRFTTDKIDFSSLPFSYTEIENQDVEDLELATYAILFQLGLIID